MAMAAMASINYHLFLSISFLWLPSHHAASAQPAAVKAAYWFPSSGFPAANIDSTLFTHLFCAFADLNATSYQVTLPSSNAPEFSTFTSTVRQKNPSVLTLLSIGGGGGGPSTEANFASMASQASSRKSFIDSSIQVARSNGFLGLDLDWEYPRTVFNMTNLGTLLQEWRAAINSESSDSGQPPLLFTAAFYFSSVLNSVKYPTDSIQTSLDWVNVMAYDYYDPTWKRVTSAHALLYDSSSQISTSAGIGDWTRDGLSSEKLVLGLPFYGYAWELVDAGNNGLGSPATGPASGPGIDSSGAISFNRVKSFIRDNGATTAYDGSVVVNYCYAGSTWIGYDDEEAIQAKVSFAKDKGLLGYFAWAVSGDDNWVLTRRASSTWG